MREAARRKKLGIRKPLIQQGATLHESVLQAPALPEVCLQHAIEWSGIGYSHVYAEDVAAFADRMTVPANDPDPETFGLATKFPNTKEDALVAVIDTLNPSEIHMYVGKKEEENLVFILHVAENSSDGGKNSGGGHGQDWIRSHSCPCGERHSSELFLEPKCHMNETMRTQLFFPKYRPDWVGIICSDCKNMMVEVLLARRLEVVTTEVNAA